MEKIARKKKSGLPPSFISTCHQGSATVFVTLALRKPHNVMSREI